MSIIKANNIIYGVGGNCDDINTQHDKKILGNVKFTKWGKKCNCLKNKILFIK